MNAVVYARFSSHRQGEQSIEGQVAEAERFAKAHDLTIIHVYADRAQTGRNDNREQFQQMLADAAKHAFDALIVWKTDRIGRNKEEIALNKYHLKKNGVKIFYVAEAIPDTPEGIILEAVIEGMAAYYSEQLSQNVRRGMRASAQKAQHAGGAHPLGYTVDENKKYIIDPKHAPTVQLIFDMYATGKTITEIVNELNNRGIRTPKGKLFTFNSLNKVLKNKKATQEDINEAAADLNEALSNLEAKADKKPGKPDPKETAQAIVEEIIDLLNAWLSIWD